MVITVEMIMALIAIASPLFIGAFALWGRIEKKFKEYDQATVLRINTVKTDHDKTQDRLEALEKTVVLKDDYQADREATNRALEAVSLALREGNATITSRVDLILFELGRQGRTDGK